MKITRQSVAVAGLLATMGAAAYMVVQVAAQSPAAVTGDFRNAAVAEIRDAQSRTVLQGQFAAAVEDDEDDDDAERKAPLKPMGTEGGPSGEAEVEYAKTGTVTTQEVEFSAKGLQANAAYTFLIDGQTIATVTADGRGRAHTELEVKIR
jgi:hypothetical protein